MGGSFGRSGCRFIRAVAAADDSGFASGTGAGVGRAVGVDEDDALAGAAEVVGGPGAEDTGSDDGYVVSHPSFLLLLPEWRGRWWRISSE